MKKKLIAIVASLAMVATMVPATAFGAAATNGEFTLDAISTDGLDADYDGLRTTGNEANIEFGTRGSVITVDGVLPWAEVVNFSTTSSLQKGNYLGLELGVPAQNNSQDWFAKVDGLHTLANQTEARTTDLVRLTAGQPDIMLMKVEPKVYTFEYYSLADTSLAGEAAITGKNHLWFKTSWADAEKYAASGNYANHAYGTTAELTTMLTDATKATLTCDTTNVTLLNAKDTRDLKEFVDAVAAIDDGGNIVDIGEADAVTPAYKRAVIAAQTIYDALTDDQKAAINKAPLKEDGKNYKKAYEALETAQKNVAGNKAAEKLIEDINALPALPATAFADKAAIEAAYTPMAAAEKDYGALTPTQKGVVTNYSDLVTYRTNYDRLIKAYVDPIYAEAAILDLEQPLTAENIALITDLKGYVDGKYIDTANIAGFTQAKYDALMEALKKVAKDEASLENATIAAIADQAYTGSAIEPAVTVTDQAGKEVAAEEYTVIYSNNKDAGTATVTVAAKSSSAYTGSVSATFTITPAALTADMVKVANATYTGKAVTPAVSVASGVDYTVAYKNNTAVGKASAVVTGTGNYTGTITKNFIVKPAKESITSLKAGKKQITVAYKAQTGAKYRVICKASGLKAIGTNTTATKKTVKKLKSGKTYQVKVRAYKAVDGKTYYGTYSAVKKVKVK